MKKIYLAIILPILLASCLGYKELPVEYDYSYKGNFKKYRTFDIMKPAGPADSTMTNEIIEKQIVARMKFLGYKQNSSKPHLIVGFKMFDDSLKFNGYIQPEIEDWVKNQNEDIEYDPQKFNLNQGTLLIQFYDRRPLISQTTPGSNLEPDDVDLAEEKLMSPPDKASSGA